MDKKIRKSKHMLLKAFPNLCKLYPKLKSVGSPFYIQNRARVATKLIFTDGTKRCSAVAKLLLESNLRRRLKRHETCDHVDGNTLNDKLRNLQVLSRYDNCKKGPSQVKREKARMLNRIRVLGKPRYDLRGSKNGMSKLTDRQVRSIKKKLEKYVRGLDAVVASQFGVSRELISQIRRGVLRK